MQKKLTHSNNKPLMTKKEQLTMSNEKLAMSNRVPELRFPEFEGEWEVKRIGDSFKERVEKNRGDLPLLSLGEEGLTLQSESQRKDNSNSDKSKYLRVTFGDIAYNTMRMWQGRCVYCNMEGIVSPAYTVCEPNEGTDPLFHYYLFKTPQMINLFHQNSQGLVSDTLNLKYEAFSRIKYLVPTLAEQQKIASCLSSVDDLIQAESDQLQALKDHKKGLMQQLFPQEGETTPKLRFPGFEGIFTPLKISEKCSMFSGGTPKSSTPEFYGGNIPFIKSGEIHNATTEQFLTELGLNSSSAKMVNKGDLLYALYGANSGDVAVSKITGAINQAILCIRSISINCIYLSYFLEFSKDSIISKYLQGGQGNLSGEIVGSIIVPTPTLPEQQKIADCLSALDEEIAAQQQKVEALKEHKKGLMQKLFPAIN